MNVPLPLPALSPDESAHSERLVQRIGAAIEAAGGWISFERFMEMALYEPGLGYYSAGATKLGSEGDFVTAPEISPLFSRCLANQCVQVLDAVAGGQVLELGAGSGVMAADVLSELDQQGKAPSRYLILEVSADLRERQRSLLQHRVPHLIERIEWLDSLPEEFRGVLIANEVLDALPVQRFRIRGLQVNQLGVTWQFGRLEWSEVHADAALESAVREIEFNLGEPFADGYTSEINLRLQPWIAGIGASMREGAALFIDYGLPRRQYYAPNRSQGTMLCHFRHRFHDDPLINVGVQDIGSWVDFTAVAESAVAAGMSVAGYTTQAHFLIGTGIEQFLAPKDDEDLAGRLQMARQAMLLTLPGEMGERFKVIGLSKGLELPLRGFGVRDLAASL
ncbi:SAM-dependent methyltransferase [Steroidobacter sp. S1-65]|uniref:SAM-dependent methyltransferase n=1 Tax=Steroidobacter gossypii TaxID=2805490 RepID=A0ABS1X373_9GAMM|nr:SAM-dependent methyltransferase [Steroidobacter gossypii]MBM0107666.1 SAM-dependent methyltransferase [Steroidobacter gossypii]